MLNIGEVLVVSPDDEVRQNLADTLAQCGLEAVLSSTIAESQTALDRNSFRIVFCADQLVDGNYRDIVREVGRTATKVPVIVVS